jgi:hypothetical protein
VPEAELSRTTAAGSYPGIHTLCRQVVRREYPHYTLNIRMAKLPAASLGADDHDGDDDVDADAAGEDAANVVAEHEHSDV